MIIWKLKDFPVKALVLTRVFFNSSDRLRVMRLALDGRPLLQLAILLFSVIEAHYYVLVRTSVTIPVTSRQATTMTVMERDSTDSVESVISPA